MDHLMEDHRKCREIIIIYNERCIQSAQISQKYHCIDVIPMKRFHLFYLNKSSFDGIQYSPDVAIDLS